MHELSIAQSIVDTVLASTAERPTAAVASIHLRIGPLSDIAQDALQFGFDVITRGTRLEHTMLAIEAVSIVARCRKCNLDFDVHNFLFLCPECGNVDVQLLRGNELEIDHIMLEDSTDTSPGETATGET